MAQKQTQEVRPLKVTDTQVLFEKGGRREVRDISEGRPRALITGGAMHRSKNNVPDHLKEKYVEPTVDSKGRTKLEDRGIPVLVFEDTGEVQKVAEIEIGELIFDKASSDVIENLAKQTLQDPSNEELAYSLGKYFLDRVERYGEDYSEDFLKKKNGTNKIIFKGSSSHKSN